MSEYSNQSGKSVLVIIIITVVLAAGGASWYFFKYVPEQEALEKARLEQIAKENAEKKQKAKAAKLKAQYDKLIADADKQFKQQNWELALSLYTDASNVIANQKYCQNQIAIVKSKIDEKEALQARIKAGIVDFVSPSDRYHVIVSSSVDVDLAKDYALELMKDGVNARIIEDAGSKKLFNRVTVADYTTLEEAVVASESFKNYSDKVWVLRF